MSAVAEKPGRTRVELTQRALAERREEQTALAAEIEQLTTAEHDAVRELLQTSPSAEPFKIGSKPSRLREKRLKAERRLETVRGLVSALTVQAQEQAEATAVEQLAKHTKQAAALTRQEEERWREAGEEFARLIEAWNALAAVFEQRELLRAEVEQMAQLEVVRAVDPDAVSRWQNEIEFIAPRAPRDVAAFVELLTDVMLEGERPERTETVATYADASLRPQGEPARTVTIGEGGSRKYGSRLPSLLADARGSDRRISLSPSHVQGISILGQNAQPGSQFAGVVSRSGE